MFPLPLLTYVKISVAILLLSTSFYLGFRLANNRFLEYKADQIAKTAKIEKEHQEATDQIRKEKDAQIASINNQLVDAVSQLRQRPSRAQSAANGQSCNGSSLPAEDAEFLVREAARADQIRAGLQACYQQYDAIK